ncbi:DUF4249 domain-containing protein [Mucilaginibacter sp. OK098]|uniref:DUF4249 domain-containing protein n=1 Tax=Mucilaginibacter sp. OK098 TaxID=1855297 RepID=UPI000910E33D|nr:DUF4249 domain-containing protein [Mucilaginibacter sp. OK098]SHM80006.1 protein of unknown function [Mucilaginibacter sp. OK098]
MKNIPAFLIVFTIIITFSACTKTITPSLNNSTRLVIEGAVSDTAGPYHVSISKTANFYSDNVYPAVSGATVVITDVTTNITDVLTEAAQGDYVTHAIVGKPGDTYQMKVMLDGKTYTATSTMPNPVLLDSVTVDYEVSNNIRPTANYQDPANQKNYYKYSMQKNGIHVNHFQTFDDRLSNGRYIRDNLDCDTGTFHHGDMVKVSLVGLDAGAFNFLKEAEDVAYNNSNLVAPATPTSNITGGCIGYFSAQTVSSKTTVIKHF